ncbi:hypothetical protein [Streptomyces griseoflavus]|uniref:hypothetical protein n=1 Tax=Streptomyces griseoflavus TaxID=35619 RepID=UPI0033D75A34
MSSGHVQQDSALAPRTGPPPLAPLPFEVEAAFPEPAGTAREVTLLHLRAGRPGPDDSSIGGPLLWPADEPWPTCAAPGHYKPLSAPVGPEPVAMVPVVQLYARHVPGLVFPAGTDLLHILWCPLVHEDGRYAAGPRLHWRDSALTAAGATAAEPPRPHTAEEDHLPRPRTVSPTPAVEYPNWDLPEELGDLLDERFEDMKEERGYDYYDVATTQQSKAGGYPGWTQPPPVARLRGLRYSRTAACAPGGCGGSTARRGVRHRPDGRVPGPPEGGIAHAVGVPGGAGG